MYRIAPFFLLLSFISLVGMEPSLKKMYTITTASQVQDQYRKYRFSHGSLEQINQLQILVNSIEKLSDKDKTLRMDTLKKLKSSFSVLRPFFLTDHVVNKSPTLAQLALLQKKFIPSEYDQIKETILSKKLIVSWITCLCINKKTSAMMQDTDLSLAKTVQATIESANKNAAAAFLRHGQKHHVQFSMQLSQLLGQLARKPSKYEEVGMLCSSPNQLLAQNAFDTLLQMAKKEKTEKDLFWKMEIDRLAFYLINETLPKHGKQFPDAIERVLQTFTETHNVHGLLQLWQYMTTVKPKKKVYVQVADYFEVPLTDELSSSDSWEIFLKKILIDITDRSPCPCKVKSLVVSEKELLISKLGLAFVKKIEYQCDKKIIFNTSHSFEERAYSLAVILKNAGSISQLKEQLDEKLEEGFFKKFATLITNTLIPQKSFEYFQSLRKLKSFEDSNAGLMGNFKWPMYRKSLPNCYNQLADSPSNLHFVGVRDPLIEQSQVFGLKGSFNSEYQLFCFDKSSGDALWQCPFKVKKSAKFICNENNLYISNVAESGETLISILNKKNGSYCRTISFNETKPVHFMSLHEGILTVVTCDGYDICGEHTFIQINLETSELKKTIIHKGEKNGGFEYFLVGNKIVRYYYPDDSFHIYDPTHETIIKSNQEMSTFTTFGSKLYYTDQRENKEQLVCYDAQKGKELWSYELEDTVTGDIIANDESVFYVSEEKVIALVIDQTKHKPYKSWENIPKENHTKIELSLSQDGQLIYALGTYNGKLYTLNVSDGSQKFLGDYRITRITHIQDISGGNIYLQGISS